MGTISKISIVNKGLISLGESPAMSLTDNTKAMRLVNAIYDQTRDSILREHPWKCCIKSVLVAPPLAVTPAFDWAYAFQLPPDFLRLVRLQYLNTQFKIEGQTILSMSNNVPLVYVFRNETEGTWDPLLCDAMSARLAYELCMPITADSQKVQIMFNAYTATLNKAKFTNAVESDGSDATEASQLLDSRLSWSGLPMGLTGNQAY